VLKINVPEYTNKKNPIFFAFTAVTLFVGIMGALFSMLEISYLPQDVGATTPLDSFKILLNQLFTISEQHQAYIYDRFVVSVPPESYGSYIFVALGIIGTFVAAYIYIMHRQKSRAMCLCIFLLFTGVQVYFGVFAAPIWNIVLYGAIAWFLLRGANKVVFASTVIIIASMVLLIYPGESPFLSQLSENIRDQFGETTERPVLMADAPPQEASAQEQAQDLEMREEAASPGSGQQGREYGIDRDERFSGSHLGAAIGQRLWVLWLIGLAFTVGFALWFMGKIIAAYKRQAVFNSSDCAAAIDSIFKHIVEWLVEFGINPQNQAYSSYAEQLEHIVSGHYADNYRKIVELWQKAVYSSHTMTEKDKKRMHSFLHDTKNTITKSLNPFARVRMRMRLFLYGMEVQNAKK